jgi:hypothetical protein
MTSPPARGDGSARAAVLAVLALAAAAIAGCGFGEGEPSDGTASLTVTRDYGAEEMLSADVEDPTRSETVMRMLDREADIETRYGGGFVQSIDGVSGTIEDGRRTDWFFYVNGAESPIGAADVEVAAGDSVWWDHHDWSDVMRVPAVVGSYPAPFSTGEATSFDCGGLPDDGCGEIEAAIEDAGGEVAPRGEAGAANGPRLVAGPWEEVADDRDARLLGGPPPRSGVFASFDEGAATELVLYDQALAEGDRLGPGAGLVAAVEGKPDAPVWVVTGTDAEGAAAAADLLSEGSLADRFAVATSGDGDPVALPVGDLP